MFEEYDEEQPLMVGSTISIEWDYNVSCTTEFVTIDAYGVMQTALMVAIVPVVLYFMVTTLCGLKTKVKDDMNRFSHRHDHHHVSDSVEHCAAADLLSSHRIMVRRRVRDLSA